MSEPNVIYQIERRSRLSITDRRARECTKVATHLKIMATLVDAAGDDEERAEPLQHLIVNGMPCVCACVCVCVCVWRRRSGVKVVGRRRQKRSDGGSAGLPRTVVMEEEVRRWPPFAWRARRQAARRDSSAGLLLTSSCATAASRALGSMPTSICEPRKKSAFSRASHHRHGFRHRCHRSTTTAAGVAQ